MRGHQANEHIELGASLTMNVSAEADAAFMRELEREDAERYQRLVKNIQPPRFGPVGASSTVVIRRHRCVLRRQLRQTFLKQPNRPKSTEIQVDVGSRTALACRRLGSKGAAVSSASKSEIPVGLESIPTRKKEPDPDRSPLPAPSATRKSNLACTGTETAIRSKNLSE
jgi:hypothetical protein